VYLQSGQNKRPQVLFLKHHTPFSKFRTRQPALIFPNVVAQRHIFGGRDAHAGAMTPTFELGRDFCTVHLTPKFHHLMFTVRKLSCWQTNKQTQPQTNKQTPLKASNALRYATALG